MRPPRKHAVTGTSAADVTVVTTPACHLCADAQATLAVLARDHPLTVRVVDASSQSGQALVRQHGTGMFPLVVLDGVFFSAGRLPRRKLARVLSGRATVKAG